MAMSDKERFEQKVARQPTGPLPAGALTPTGEAAAKEEAERKKKLEDDPIRQQKLAKAGIADPENPETAEEAREAEEARTKRRIERDLKRSRGETIEPEDGEIEAVETERNQPLTPPETPEQAKEREAKAKSGDRPAEVAPQDKTKGFDRDEKRATT